MIAWLGTPHNECELAVSWLQKMYKDKVDSNVALFGYGEVPKSHDPEWTASEGRALLMLFGHQYFGRAWIIQEVMLATRIVVACGDNSASWKTLARFSAMLTDPRNQEQSANRPFVKQLSNSKGCNIVLAKETWWSRITPNERLSLDVLIVVFNFTECTLPHDKIYALLPLARSQNGDRASTGLQIDYNKRIVDVYDDVLHYLYTKPPLGDADIQDCQKFVKILQQSLGLSPVDKQVQHITEQFLPTLDTAVEGFPSSYHEEMNRIKNKTTFIRTLNQYNELQQQTMVESMEMAKAKAFWDLLESMSKRDATS